MTTLTPAEFLTSRFVGDARRKALYPQVVADFLRLDAPSSAYDCAVLSGGIGWGRTELAELRMLYALHRAVSTPNLRESLGVPPESPLTFVVWAAPGEVSRLTAVASAITDPSPHFVGGVRVMPGRLGLSGFHVIGGIVTDVPHARHHFLELRDRMRVCTRDASWRGSLTWHAGGSAFTVDPRVAVLHYPTWGTRIPHSEASVRAYLWIRVNDDRSVELLREPPPGGTRGVIPIPPEYAPMFERNLETAVRDLLGLDVV